MKIVKEEIFGLVSAIIKFSTKRGMFRSVPQLLLFPFAKTSCSTCDTEVIDATNNTEYGLACHIFTENVRRAVRVAHRDWHAIGHHLLFHPTYFLRAESGLLLSGQLRRVWARRSPFWRVQTVWGGEGVGEACVGHVRSRSFSSMCVGMLIILLFMRGLECIHR